MPKLFAGGKRIGEIEVDNQEKIKDYFETGRTMEFINLMKKALIEGWEKQTNQPFTPCKAEFNMKRGRMLFSSYEAVKLQEAGIYLAVIKKIGAYTAKACEGCSAYSDFVIDSEIIAQKQLEHAAMYVFCNQKHGMGNKHDWI